MPPTEYGVPVAGLPRDPGPLRLLGVPTGAAAEVKRGLMMLTGRVGLVIAVMMVVGWRLLSRADDGRRVRV